MSLIAILGPGAEELEETIDWLVIGDGSDPSRFLTTSSHKDETFDDVLNMVQMWESEHGWAIEEVRL
ncbi:hypothetical protein [Methylobrevis pamukkalensis]|uniref:hypothetical protein n=1 Tax=Methylobrevis pamukkalensis TaxID=1439726 RepID=UPI001FDA725E|nr:hypothetical protein [Methylobrevis pamukkalensis]